MDDMLNILQKYGSITLIIFSILAIFLSGIFFSIAYLVMDEAHDGFLATDCVIEGNLYVNSCQELWDMTVYPFFALKELLIWGSYFFIFAFVIGMLVAGYQSGKSPVLLGVLILFVVIITYAGIEFANIYRTMLEVPAFLSMVTPFVIYNKIMLNFPWFVFITGLFSAILGIVNFQRSNVNDVTPEALSY